MNIKSLKKILTLSALLCCVFQVNADSNERVLKINTEQVEKDLSHSYLGANAQQFRSHYSIRKMLDNKDIFSKFLLNIGSPVLRMDGRSEFGWFSKEETLALREAKAKIRRLSAYKEADAPDWDLVQVDEYDEMVKKYKLPSTPIVIETHNPDVAWFPPEEFHAFCRSNNIQIIGAFGDDQYYDPETKKVVRFRNNPKYFDGAVADNMRKLSWVLKNGYKDLYVAWEIGNESFTAWDPVLYAEYTKKIVDAAKALQPDIKLSIPTILRNTDDPFIKQFIESLKKRGQNSDWFTWHEKMIPALGDYIKKIDYVTIHVYGARSIYNANYRGLSLATDLSKLPNTDHLRFLATEWRYTGVGGSDHRTFAMGAIWNAKFAMTILSHPKIDYSTAHEFLCSSGLGYWSPGKGNTSGNEVGDEWVFQYQENAKPSKTTQLRTKEGKPQFDIGPFGPVNKMLNDLIRDCPMLLEHKADLGPMSSAIYADGLSLENKSKKPGDLDWFICTDKDRSKIGGVIVNTQDKPVRLVLDTGKNKYTLQNFRQMSCDSAKFYQAEVPGESKFWKLTDIPLKDNVLILAPNSVSSFRGTLKTSDK